MDKVGRLHLVSDGGRIVGSPRRADGFAQAVDVIPFSGGTPQRVGRVDAELHRLVLEHLMEAERALMSTWRLVSSGEVVAQDAIALLDDTARHVRVAVLGLFAERLEARQNVMSQEFCDEQPI
jgi:hypothetical protein